MFVSDSLVGKAKSLPYSGAPGKVPGLLTMIRLGRKCLPGSTTPAYNEHSEITAVKSFCNIVP